MAWKRILIVAAAAAVAAFVGWRVFLIVRPPSSATPTGAASGQPNNARRSAPVAVEVADVTRTTLRDRVVFSGVLESRSRLVVTAKVAGRLERVPVRVGDEVRRGGLLAELEDEDNPEVRATIRARLRALAEQKTRLEGERERLQASRLAWQQTEASLDPLL